MGGALLEKLHSHEGIDEMILLQEPDMRKVYFCPGTGFQFENVRTIFWRNSEI